MQHGHNERWAPCASISLSTLFQTREGPHLPGQKSIGSACSPFAPCPPILPNVRYVFLGAPSRGARNPAPWPLQGSMQALCEAQTAGRPTSSTSPFHIPQALVGQTAAAQRAGSPSRSTSTLRSHARASRPTDTTDAHLPSAPATGCGIHLHHTPIVAAACSTRRIWESRCRTCRPEVGGEWDMLTGHALAMRVRWTRWTSCMLLEPPPRSWDLRDGAVVSAPLTWRRKTRLPVQPKTHSHLPVPTSQLPQPEQALTQDFFASCHDAPDPMQASTSQDARTRCTLPAARAGSPRTICETAEGTADGLRLTANG